MNITYKDCRIFPSSQLEQLFLSVKWASGAYPLRLTSAIAQMDTVYSAWEQQKLIGLAAAMDDGNMNAYIPYVLVRPECQGNGIGTALMEKMMDHYKNYLRIALMAVNDQTHFYSRLGFNAAEDKTAMYCTSLWN